MTSTILDARRVATAAALLLSLTVACGDRSNQHASDGDTGAAAPATVRDMSATPQTPDSTSGVSRATGAPQLAGDSLGAHGRDSSATRGSGSPTRRP